MNSSNKENGWFFQYNDCYKTVVSQLYRNWSEIKKMTESKCNSIESEQCYLPHMKCMNVKSRTSAINRMIGSLEKK